jgi:hypothetical protein
VKLKIMMMNKKKKMSQKKTIIQNSRNMTIN